MQFSPPHFTDKNRDPSKGQPVVSVLESQKATGSDHACETLWMRDGEGPVPSCLSHDLWGSSQGLRPLERTCPCRGQNLPFTKEETPHALATRMWALALSPLFLTELERQPDLWTCLMACNGPTARQQEGPRAPTGSRPVRRGRDRSPWSSPIPEGPSELVQVADAQAGPRPSEPARRDQVGGLGGFCQGGAWGP